MKKVILALSFILCHFTFTTAQTARQVLDKCAATLNSKTGLQADFTMSSAQYGSASLSLNFGARLDQVHDDPDEG